MGLTAKEAKQLNESKAAVKAAWNAACEADGVDPASKFVVWTNGSALARIHNELMGAHFKLVNRIKRNIAARDRTDAIKSLGMRRVKGALGGTYIE